MMPNSESPSDNSVYVTKYALSDGIVKVPVRQRQAGFTWVSWPGGVNGQLMVRDEFVHSSLDDALKHALEMRNTKITSLKRQITKLEKMTFDKRVI